MIEPTKSNYIEKKELKIMKNENEDHFLKMLMTKMTNMNPLEPESDTEWIGQLASFEQVKQNNQMLECLRELVSMKKGESSINAIGKSITSEEGDLELLSSDGSINIKTIPGQKDMIIFNSQGDIVKNFESDPSGNTVLETKDLLPGKYKISSNPKSKVGFTGIASGIDLKNGNIIIDNYKIPFESISNISKKEKIA
jgi:flagellar hook assembly protein FlgD